MCVENEDSIIINRFGGFGVFNFEATLEIDGSSPPTIHHQTFTRDVHTSKPCRNLQIEPVRQ
jgi:hypothetical protein